MKPGSPYEKQCFCHSTTSTRIAIDRPVEDLQAGHWQPSRDVDVRTGRLVIGSVLLLLGAWWEAKTTEAFIVWREGRCLHKHRYRWRLVFSELSGGKPWHDVVRCSKCRCQCGINHAVRAIVPWRIVGPKIIEEIDEGE